MPAGWQVLIFQDPAAIDEHLCAEITRKANTGALRRVALASGATFAGFFAKLGQRTGPAAFEGIDFHHLDEFEGIEPFSQGSLSGEIRASGFPGRILPVATRPPSDALSVHEKNVAGCDLVLLGIGRNGHVAFNEPGTPLSARAHFATLAPSTRDAHARAFDGRPVPERALTAGIQTILGAREIIVAAKGAAKADAIAATLLGPISPQCPASAMRLHDRVTILLDEDAAAGLGSTSTPPWMLPTGVGIRERGYPLFNLWKSTVLVAPHPDDAGISCGGLLALLGRDAKRHIATFSTGARAIHGMDANEAARLRERESEEEARILGASVSFLRARAYASGVFEPADAADLAALFERTQPNRVLVPAREDPHPTHRLCRLTAEEALRSWLDGDPRHVEVWTFEGPWFQLARAEINVLVKLDPAAHETKQAGIRAHRSQVARVPFEAGADALERLRAITFAESHLGGRTDGGFDREARVECYRRVIIGAVSADD